MTNSLRSKASTSAVRGAGRDEHLTDHRLDRLDAEAEDGVVGRHLAPAEQDLSLGRDHGRERVGARLPSLAVARQEHHADGILAGRRQREAQPLAFGAEERVRQLDQNAGAVAGQRIGADRATVTQITQYAQAAGDDVVALAVLDVGEKPDPAGIVFVPWVVQSLLRRTASHMAHPTSWCPAPPTRRPLQNPVFAYRHAGNPAVRAPCCLIRPQLDVRRSAG